MIFGRKRKAMASSKPKHPLPLILPNGDSVDLEIFESCDYKISEYMRKYAYFAQNPSKVCLNYMSPAEAKSLLSWDLEDNPAEWLFTVLSELITKIQFEFADPIRADDMSILRQSKDICAILKKAGSLRNVPLSQLKTAKDTTCFLINLSNLMFLHTLIFKSSDCTEPITSMDWTARQSYFSSVGYLVGKLGFISLYDIHSFLLKYPTISTQSLFSCLKVFSDARIPFAIGQPFALSPKIQAVDPSNLVKHLESAENEYHTFCSMLNEAVPSSLPLPLFLKIETAYSDDQLLPHTFENYPKISEKWTSFSSHIGDVSLEEIARKGISIVNDPQVTVHFSYTNLELNSLHRVSWKFCTHHLSFFHCCMDFMLTIKMNLFENRYFEFPDKNGRQIEQEIDVFDVYNEICAFAGHLMQEEFDSDECPEEMRCLNNILLFVVGEKDNLQRDENKSFESILQILRKSIDRRWDFSHAFAKIRACEKILMLHPESRQEYSTWFDLFKEKPCLVLALMLEHGNAELAAEFVEAQYLYSPSFDFSMEIMAAFICALCVDGETPMLKSHVLRLDPTLLASIMDLLVSQECEVVKLSILVCCILRHYELTSQEKEKFYAMWMSFRMLLVIPEFEQYLFYQILYHPNLIVEQFIMNRCIHLFKKIMSVTREPMLVDPGIKKLENEFRQQVDDLIIRYAEKALFFTKDLSIKEEPSEPAEKKFEPPKKIPTFDEWVPDEKAPNCMLCKRDFTVFTRRRHHCRRCGRVVCHFCSDHKLEIFRFELKVRVCDECYEYEKPLDIVINDILNPDSLSQTKIVLRLTGKPEADDKLRREISYENGPDIAFCMGLVEQHTPNDAIARFLSIKAEEMTKILRHRLIYSANFDYDHVALCARSLTYACKLLYSNLNDPNAVRRCEEMANEIELLKLCSLVSYVPKDPNKPMREVEQWAVIKDRLTNLGEWTKALEIASKIGADTKSIWFLWGISLLKSGDWMSAREKFKYSSIKTNPSALKEIVDTIHSSEDGPKFEEGLHYISLYGSKSALYQYYIQFCKFEDAVETAFQYNISPKLFADTVILPLKRNDGWESLLKLLDLHDPSHKHWREHIRQSYRHLRGESDLSILYEFAKFVSDYYHMSLCCTKFFARSSSCYRELQNETEWLSRAMENIDKLADQSEAERFIKRLPKKKLEDVMDAITEQIEINSIIGRDESVASEKFTLVPTIFSLDRTGDQLIGLLIKAIPSLEKAFYFTLDIVNKHSLDCVACYCRAMFSLGQQNRTQEIHTLVSWVIIWIRNNIAEGDFESCIPILDTFLVHAIRGKPQNPMQFANRITDTIQKIEVLIETDQLKDAFRIVNTLDDPFGYFKTLYQMAKTQNITWLKNMIRQRVPNYDFETDEPIDEESIKAKAVEAESVTSGPIVRKPRTSS